MPAKNIPLTKNPSSSRNSIQSGSNDEENSSLKIVITKNTQNNPNDSPDWIIKTGKRHNSPGISPTSKGTNTKQNKFTYTTHNRYEVLNISDNETEKNTEKEGENENMQTENTILPPTTPPIFITTPVNYQNFCNQIKTLIGDEEFLCKTTTKNLKLTLKSSQSFRQVIKLLNDNSVEYFTYQAKEEKSYRVVIVINPAPNNPEIFKLRTICHSIVKIEEPHSRRDIPQCHRCQNYGHTRTYCNRQPRCVRCGQAHLTDMCEKSKDLPATCAICGKDHPANYRGCAVHKGLQRSRNTKDASKDPSIPTISSQPDNNEQHTQQNNSKGKPPSNVTFPRTYSDTVKSSSPSNPQKGEPNETPLSTQLSSFLENFQSLITPLINLLTTLINKILINNEN
ncbi:uncharacterized protein LOC111029454 [Myzus persicae]|uniref:uncharacterized protein LOC111029454 n=1 Tax=Myzus persicae TaxID=13164 RepID=UPI000B939DE0|nr:uncharacterized protein LOC111029454 [Myzus persicae]